MRRWLERKVVTEISRMLVSGQVQENSAVIIDVSGGGEIAKLTFSVEKIGEGKLQNNETVDFLIDGTEIHNDKKVKIEEVEDEEDEMED